MRFKKPGLAFTGPVGIPDFTIGYESALMAYFLSEWRFARDKFFVVILVLLFKVTDDLYEIISGNIDGFALFSVATAGD